jgi:ribosomal protein S18 acetylase RimI-like enzyme
MISSTTLDLPSVDGLTFRHFAGEGDFPLIVRLSNDTDRADGLDFIETIEGLRNEYAHLTNCDPASDALFAQAPDGELVAYGRIWWADETAGVRRYNHFSTVHPGWRQADVQRTMLRWFEARAHMLEAAHQAAGPKVLEVWVTDRQPYLAALYAQEGYSPVRYGYMMSRSLIDAPLPDFPLPEGFEVRTVRPGHYRAIWETDVDAFRDHNGFSEPTPDQYDRWLNDPLEFQPDLWKVAWNVQGNEVAAMVLNYINHDENREFKRLRGYTENISTRKRYRKIGLARALIAESLRMFRDMGMTEAALGVDATNPTGALRVYEACGFKPYFVETSYRKALVASGP